MLGIVKVGRCSVNIIAVSLQPLEASRVPVGTPTELELYHGGKMMRVNNLTKTITYAIQQNCFK